MNREDLKKTFYLIAEYWLGQLKGFIKIGDNKEEITNLFEERYSSKVGDWGITEQSFQLLECNAIELLNSFDKE